MIASTTRNGRAYPLTIRMQPAVTGRPQDEQLRLLRAWASSDQPSPLASVQQPWDFFLCLSQVIRSTIGASFFAEEFLSCLLP